MQVHMAMRLPKSFYKIPVTQKQLKSNYWQLQKRGILKFYEFSVSYLKSRYTETNKFRKKTLILSLTYRGKQGKGVA